MGKTFIVAPDAPMEETANLGSGRKLGGGGIRRDERGDHGAGQSRSPQQGGNISEQDRTRQQGSNLDRDRKLIAVRPPTFDAPETVGVYDPRSGTLFSADAFGALLDAPVHTATEIGPGELGDGLVLWSTVDAPWLHSTDRRAFRRTLTDLASLRPQLIAGSHLPAARDVAALIELALRLPEEHQRHDDELGCPDPVTPAEEREGTTVHAFSRAGAWGRAR